MALLTSYLWKGIELNDGLRYLIATAESAFDNAASVEASYAYRGENAPVQTGITVKEGVFALNIQIVATTPQDFDTKLNLLKQLFNTADKTLYDFQRKLPHEQYYVSMQAAPRELTVNRLERKVSITMHAPDKTWKSADWQTHTFTLFDGNTNETELIHYDGNLAVEPIIEITPTTPGSNGPVPLYFRNVTLWAHGDKQLVGVPTKIVSNWDISALVSAGKMLTGGTDIEVYLSDGSIVPCFTSGPDTALNIWIYANRWLDQPQMWLTDYPFGDTDGYAFRDSSPTIFSFITIDRWPTIASGDVLKVGDEYLTLDTFNSLASKNGYPRFFAYASARGVNGSTAVNHLVNTPVLQPTTLKVTYGYANEYVHYRNNSTYGWPLINYTTSDNKTWHQAQNIATVAGTSVAALTWESRTTVSNYVGAYVYATDTNNQAQLSRTLSAGWDNYVKDQRRTLLLKSVRRLTRINLALSAIAQTPGNVTVNLLAISGQIGTASEVRRTLWTGTFAVGTSLGTVASGWIDTNYQSNAVDILAFELDGVATTANNVTVTITGTDYELDSNLYPSVPTASALGSEQGYNGGIFPVHIVFANWNDLNSAGGASYFTIFCSKSVGQKLTIDCDSRSVDGLLLQETSYTLPRWLRLLPGDNNINFDGPSGAGQYTVTFKWKNRY